MYRFVQFGAAQVCHCGSSNCRKMLGTTKYSGSSQNHHAKKKKRKTNCENCIQQFLRLWHPRQKNVGIDNHNLFFTLLAIYKLYDFAALPLDLVNVLIVNVKRGLALRTS